jgi:hypothetical protein
LILWTDYANRRFEFKKRSQLFIRLHNERLSVVALCVNSEDRSPVGINRCDATPTPTGFAEIVSDDFPILHTGYFAYSSDALRLSVTLNNVIA